MVYFESEPCRNTGSTLEIIDEIRADILPLSYVWRLSAGRLGAEMGGTDG